MHSSAKFILNNVYCQLYWKVDNNEKEAGNGPLFLKKTRDQGFTTKLEQNVSKLVDRTTKGLTSLERWESSHLDTVQEQNSGS